MQSWGVENRRCGTCNNRWRQILTTLCILFFAAQTRALLGLRREALDTLKAAVENGFYNLPMIEYLTRPGMSFHILREDPDFHAIRADLARRIDDLRARY